MMSTTSPERPHKQPKRACTECRQQKAKCDSYLQPEHPCSRCRRLNLPCFISDAFKRQHKRDRLSELEQEAEALRKKLRTSEPAEYRPSLQPSAPGDAFAQLTPLSQSYTPSSVLHKQAADSRSHKSLVNGAVVSGDEEPTISRTLNGVLVTAREVDELFQIFFRNYAQCLRILDSRTTPNTFFSNSEFLFWSIIGVACRRYTSNPNLFSALSHSIIDLALLSANSSSRPIFAIHGLLLQLTWPPIRAYTKLDITYPLAGLLMHKARQTGLHQPFATHEFHFSKERSLRLTETEIAMRSELWTRCVIVYQRTCVSKGQLPQQIPIEPHTIDPGLKLQLRCDDVVTRCCAAIAKHGLQDMNSDRERALELILEAYSDHVKDIEVEFSSYSSYKSLLDDDTVSWETRSSIGTFHIQLAQLNIQVFHLYRNSIVTFHSPLAALLATACKVLDIIEALLEGSDAPPALPNYITYGLMLSSFVLLRLLKYSSLRGIDVERATARLSYGINLAKSSSLVPNDLAAKIAIFTTQMWNSPKAFRKDDGSIDMSMRVFNRFTMGVVMDLVWRWYDLFDEQAKLPNEIAQARKDVGRNITGSPVLAAPLETVYAPAGLDFPSGDIFGDMSFPDFDWSLGDDIFTL